MVFELDNLDVPQLGNLFREYQSTDFELVYPSTHRENVFAEVGLPVFSESLFDPLYPIVPFSHERLPTRSSAV